MPFPSLGLTAREIHADLEGMGVRFDPRWPRLALLIQRNAARSRRKAARAPN
jgi:hypothetical protein